MAVYKVPQDVEADDKLIGPFSPRQFVYLFIVAMAIALAWGLSKIFIPLLFVPTPIIILFGALALPLRKDQPMETYMAAMVSFFLKPHRRIWEPDGIDSIIEITAPKTVDIQRIKDISRGEAERKLGYLAEIVDTQGWAVRGSGVTAPNSAMITDAYFEAQQTQDVMDFNNVTAQSFDKRLSLTEAKRHQDAVNSMLNPQPQPQPQPQIQMRPQYQMQPQYQPQPEYQQQATAPIPVTDLEKEMEKEINFNPYPGEMQQSVIQPIGVQPRHIDVPDRPNATADVSTSEKPIAADIIKLASNTDLSIEAIAHEAGRIHKKQDISQEIVISLR